MGGWQRQPDTLNVDRRLQVPEGAASPRVHEPSTVASAGPGSSASAKALVGIWGALLAGELFLNPFPQRRERGAGGGLHRIVDDAGERCVFRVDLYHQGTPSEG